MSKTKGKRKGAEIPKAKPKKKYVKDKALSSVSIKPIFDSIVVYYQTLIEKSGGVNKACKIISKELNYQWTWKHIYAVMVGWANPSKELLMKLEKLAQPPRPRYRWKVEALTEAQLKSWMNNLTMEDVRWILDQAVRDKKTTPTIKTS